MNGRLTRRQVVWGLGVAGLGLVAGCGLPVAAPPAKVPRIGVLSAKVHESFPEALRDLGYVDGQSVVVDFRQVDERGDRLLELAAELAHLPADVIVAPNEPIIRAVKDATDTIPIVMVASGDPVGFGLITSLARPGGNITGLSAFGAQLAGKRVEFLKELRPDAASLGVLGPRGSPELPEVEAVARALRLQLRLFEVSAPEGLEGALNAASQESVPALYVLQGPWIIANFGRIAELALARRLPTIATDERFPPAGGLMAYGPSQADLWRRAATYIDKILKGARPADLPVEQPTKFYFGINLKTAQALGLTIPPHVLLQATEVIQ